MQISDEMKALEALARAYDHEEAACMGEPSPWVSADSEGDDEWKAERIVAARAGLDAYRSALSLPVQPVAWRIYDNDEGEWWTTATKSTAERWEADGKVEPLYANPVPPTKGPEDDLIAALEKRAKWHKCSCPEPCDDYGVFPGGCAGLYREDYLSLLALRSRPASALPVVDRAAIVEECAKIAESRFTEKSVIKNRKGNPYPWGAAAIYAGQQIAKAIRSDLAPSVQP